MITVLYALLCILLAAACFFTWRNRNHSKRRKAVLSASALLLIAAFCFVWLSDFYPADPESGQYLVSAGGVKLERSVNGWRFDGPGEAAALIFYPGAKVEAAAYAPLLFSLAAGGVDAFLVQMPFRLAVLDQRAAERLIGTYPYRRWILAGHSLGGAMASGYAAAHADTVGGLVLLAAYPTEKLDDSQAFLSVYGDRDGVLNFERYETSRACWPRTAQELVIPGGNHAQFGNYGPQSGDGEAAISRAEQQKLTVDAILRWIG